MPNKTHQISSPAGFTLIELMLALGISVLVVGSVSVAATNFARTYVAFKSQLEIQHNLRAASEMLFRDLRTAGYGLHEISNPISDWVPGFTNMVAVDEGTTANDPDRLRILGAQAIPGGELRYSASAGTTVLTLKPNAASHLDTSTRDIVVVGRLETAHILGISGDNITISINPSSPGAGLQYDHAANTPVELVTVTTYECVTSNLTQTAGQPYLVRYQNSASAPSPAILAMAAVGIENFQISLASNKTYSVALTGKMSRPDKDYVHPVAGDHYRRYALQTAIQSIN